jgi:hypothetical protein
MEIPELPVPDLPLPSLPTPRPSPVLAEALPSDSFLPLVKLEFMEALALLGINGLLALSAAWTADLSLSTTYRDFWLFLLPVHGAVSWTFMMVPLVLAGHSPLMGQLGLVLDTDQPELRMSFSLFHTLSVCLFPLSFLCMVLTPSHRTLAELLTNQEIFIRPPSRSRQ